MYFFNRQSAWSHESLLRGIFANADTPDMHQAVLGMFFQTMFNEASSKGRAHSHNAIKAIAAPDNPVTKDGYQSIINAVRMAHLWKTHATTGSIYLAVYVTKELHGDTRFAKCPVGSVALFAGLFEPVKWCVIADTLTDITPVGYFETPTIYVPLSHMGLFLFGSSTQWHGPHYYVDHLRRHGRPARLISRPLDKTFVLVDACTAEDSNIRDTWFIEGMRFDVTNISAPRLLTTTEETPALVGYAPIKGKQQAFDAAVEQLDTLIRTASHMVGGEGKCVYNNTHRSPVRESKAVQWRVAVGQFPDSSTTIEELNAVIMPHGAEVGRSGSAWVLKKNGRVFPLDISTRDYTVQYVLNIIDQTDIPLACFFTLADICRGVVYVNSRRLDAAIKTNDLSYHYHGAIAILCQNNNGLDAKPDRFPLKPVCNNATNAPSDSVNHITQGHRHITEFYHDIGEPKLLRTRATLHKKLTRAQRKKVLAVSKKPV